MMNKQENHRPGFYTFLEAAGSYGKIPEHHMTERQRMDYEAEMRMRGALRLKRYLVGFCGKEATKTLDELAEALVRAGVIEKEKQVQGILQQGLLGHPLPYRHRFGKRRELLITVVEGDATWDDRYRCVVQEHHNHARKK